MRPAPCGLRSGTCPGGVGAPAPAPARIGQPPDRRQARQRGRCHASLAPPEAGGGRRRDHFLAVTPAGPRPPRTDEWKADVNMRTQYDDIEQNEVLWITPEVCFLPELPDGFALRVDDFLGRDHSGGREPPRVWVRGPVLLDTRGTALRTITLCVPVDQPRAVPADRTPAHEAPASPASVEPPRAVGVASTGGGAHRADERDRIEHEGRVYRRVEIPRQ